ncbi:hypothetical protein AK812_SmicGene2665 [Symbiodinium microadriaticum]|uniref:Uncharacterized protein n=1 Tax=Symbiodinium microadriaticum TaxID=2951 RepID=A0A1Q9F0Y0_SYMMI|nr:hypothetical protein AK812_SmicGene2665 [Symbiodinium microadriaticum]
MPTLPDGSFAVAEAWFAKKGKSKTPADDFWRHYDGFGQRHISFSWPDEVGQTTLHEAAAFGRPTQAAAVLAMDPEIWKVETSKGRTALDVAQDAIQWCAKHGRLHKEWLRHQQVAELCKRARDGKVVEAPETDPELQAAEPGPPGYFSMAPSVPGLRRGCELPPPLPSGKPRSALVS